MLKQTSKGLIYHSEEDAYFQVALPEKFARRTKTDPFSIAVMTTGIDDVEEYIEYLATKGFGQLPHFVIAADGKTYQTLPADQLGLFPAPLGDPAKSVCIAVCNPGRLRGIKQTDEHAYAASEFEGMIYPAVLSGTRVCFSKEQSASLLKIVCAIKAALGNVPVFGMGVGESFDGWEMLNGYDQPLPLYYNIDEINFVPGYFGGGRGETPVFQPTDGSCYINNFNAGRVQRTADVI